MSNEEKIVWLGDYKPTESRFEGSYSRTILDFKEGKRFLNENVDRGLTFKFCTVPRSQPGQEKAGFRKLYQLLKKDPNYGHRIVNTNDANLLERSRPIQKQTTLLRRERSVDQHLNSIFARNLSSKDCVILFDDVITTGCSMQASCQILTKAGAKVLWAIGLGKTI